MLVSFTKDAKTFLFNNHNYIAKDNPTAVKEYTAKLIKRIVDMLQTPNIGKINAVFDNDTIREITLDGMKVIYKKYPKNAVVLMVYRSINFDESQIDTEPES